MDGMDNGDEENGDEHEGMEESGPTADLALGEEAYNANCLACHSIGGGDGVGPDLEGTGEKHGYDTMVGIIKDPEGVGIEYMPSFAQLDDETIDAIVQYLGIYPGHEVDPGMHHGHEH
jgi:mono/diheme cytochrome c family protein